ncbi:type II toxin-antitoxin system VapC family toxin [Amycolatopsis pithecellobii]|uniref:Ribonuclease VapC n=1 Tax=Amycolatopsis pithecellobii TaxID=664692 RepID=A0A6N7Z1X5_9PSEU|nr:type II toxin-antitoxin system VapC family toxin [Amycolatopsis pithecellobii]MTD53654.1 PIN domain-containing protein [Amycolatopsis pithecellobii]
MLIVDVNVLVYAFRVDAQQHEKHRSWLQDKLLGVEPVGISELVLSGFLRLVTNHRIFRVPTTPSAALEFCEAIRRAPAAVSIRPGSRHWQIFAGLCRTVDARANLVPDAYHAALALENDATWVSNDRDFAKFPGLRWAQPFA